MGILVSIIAINEDCCIHTFGFDVATAWEPGLTTGLISELETEAMVSIEVSKIWYLANNICLKSFLTH